MSVKDYNKEASLNVSISGINIAEGCAPSGINDAIRQLMADVKEESEAQAEAVAGAESAASSQVSELDTTLRKVIAEEVAKYLPLAGGAMTGDLDMGRRSITDVSGIELKSPEHGGVIDFHFDGSPADHTSRIIENAQGRLDITAPNGLCLNSNDVLTSAGGGVTGSLVSTASPYNFIAKHVDIDATVTPTANTFVGYEMRDKNDKRLAWAGYRKSTDGRDFYEIQVVGTSGRLTIFNDGEVTTAKGPLNPLVAWGHGSGGLGSWYRRFSDGLTIQRIIRTAGVGKQVVNLLLPMTNNWYTVSPLFEHSTGGDCKMIEFSVTNKSNTSFEHEQFYTDRGYIHYLVIGI